MPTIVLLLYLITPVFAALLLDIDAFVLFMVLLGVAAGLSTSSVEPLANRSHEESTPDNGRNRKFHSARVGQCLRRLDAPPRASKTDAPHSLDFSRF